mmetsp:Transcript_3739/g.8989  ORF Transcript_3739/g.8989 Transcript_3739/m.8989 type:complete len:466 (-) Transcript_3739:292-1689(-)
MGHVKRTYEGRRLERFQPRDLSVWDAEYYATDVEYGPTQSHCSLLEVYGGNVLHRCRIPNLQDAYDKFGENFASDPTRVQEGGRLMIRYFYKETDSFTPPLLDDTLSEIIHVVGRAFHNPMESDDPNGFASNDAEVAHHLLYHGKDIFVAVMEYYYTDPHTGSTMVAIAGAMILSGQVRMQKLEWDAHQGDYHSRTLQRKSMRVLTLVQIAVHPDYSQRNLGQISLLELCSYLKTNTNQIKADFVFWAGCFPKFYRRCGFQTADATKYKEIPFKIPDISDKENESMFFFFDLEHNDKEGNAKNKYQDLLDWVTEDSGTPRHLRLVYPANPKVAQYYGISEEALAGQTKTMQDLGYIDIEPEVVQIDYNKFCIRVSNDNEEKLDWQKFCMPEVRSIGTFVFLEGRFIMGDNKVYGFTVNWETDTPNVNDGCSGRVDWDDEGEGTLHFCLPENCNVKLVNSRSIAEF